MSRNLQYFFYDYLVPIMAVILSCAIVGALAYFAYTLEQRQKAQRDVEYAKCIDSGEREFFCKMYVAQLKSADNHGSTIIYTHIGR